MRRLSALLVAVLALGVLLVHAQTTSHSQVHSTLVRPPATYFKGSFDPSIQRLPAHFKGHDIRAVMQAVESAPRIRDKGEFETTSAYNARIDSFRDQPLFGGLRVSSIFAFVDDQGSEFDYDADIQRLIVHVGLSSVRFRQSSRMLGSYIGSNAFNAKVRITKYHNEDYGVLFKAKPEIKLDIPESVALTPEEARRHKPGFRVVYVCSLVAPWADYSEDVHEPTITSPEDVTTETHNLIGEIKSVWMFDENTGEVIQKFDAVPDLCSNKPGDEPYADCTKRTQKWTAECAAKGGDGHLCYDKLNAEWNAEREARFRALPICDSSGLVRPCRLK